MHRRRSALSLSAAAALLAAAPLLTACGGDARPGAAAVVEGERITMAQLQGRVADVRDAQASSEQGEEMIERTGQLTRATLDGMIRLKVVAYAAEERGIEVTDREVQRARAELESQAGGRQELERALLAQQSISPEEIDQRLWLTIAVEKIAKVEGLDPQSPQDNERLTEVFADASADMDIDVNPRYGEWQDEDTALATGEDPWLRDLTGQAADREAS